MADGSSGGSEVDNDDEAVTPASDGPGPATVALESGEGQPSPPTGGGRLIGIDIARALAFGGMLLAHFAFSYDSADPGWLQAMDNAADGRAAPLFCVLLGVGAGILASRGTSDWVFVKRGLVVFAIGAAIWPEVDTVYLILPHYGLLLALVPLLRRVPGRWLLPLAMVSFITPSVIAATVDDHGLRSGLQPDSYGELLNLWDVLVNLVWTGGYPLVGWLGFALVGMWLIRQPLGRLTTQRRLLAGALLVVVTQPLLAAGFDALGGSPEPDQAGGLAVLFDPAAHSNQAAWYVLASATAVAIIAACLLLTRRPRPAARPLVHLGQLMLSAYLAHLALGELGVWDWLDRTRPSLGFQVALVAAIFVVLAAAATAWRSRYRRGPLEALVRAASG